MKYFYKRYLNFLFTGFIIAAIACIQAATNYTAHNTAPAPVILQAVDIIYFQDFPWKKDHGHSATSGCFVASASRTSPGFTVKPFLRCKEYVHLLRPQAVIKQWKKKQAQDGFILFSLPEYGINDTKARIIKISHIPPEYYYQAPFKKHTNRVTGVFLRHVMDVEKYRFKEKGTNNITTVNVTGSHPFYVKNRHRFIAIKDVLPTDNLINNNGQSVRILCYKNRQKDCGIHYDSATPTLVYNIEISKRHTYFISHATMLVHNTCNIYIETYYEGNQMKISYKGYIDINTGKPNGTGTSYYRNGVIFYSGGYRQGSRHGYGKRYYINRRLTYEGMHYMGDVCGYGKRYHHISGQLEYEGMHYMGESHGYGIEYFPETTTNNSYWAYIGQFNQGEHAGKGISYYSNGKPRYSGMWKDNTYHGPGTFYDRFGTEYTDVWNMGRCTTLTAEACKSETIYIMP